MRYITVLVVALLFASPLLAETPCDFKGISVGSKMSPAQLMSALGVTKYKTNPPPHSPSLALTEKYGFIAAGEIEDWEIGPYCSTTMCTVPSGVAVGNNDNIPVKVDISFHEHLITKIVISFSEIYWDEKLTIFDQKYPPRFLRASCDFETNSSMPGVMPAYSPALMRRVLATCLLGCMTLPAWPEGASGAKAAKVPSTRLPGAAFAALETISPDHIRWHVRYLSHDLLEGRGTGQRGGDIAAEYIATQFAEYGLKPAGDHGTYMQKVPLVGITTLPDTQFSFVPKQGEAMALKLLDEYVAYDHPTGALGNRRGDRLCRLRH